MLWGRVKFLKGVSSLSPRVLAKIFLNLTNKSNLRVLEENTKPYHTKPR